MFDEEKKNEKKKPPPEFVLIGRKELKGKL